jgi:hypothetical protein
MEKDVDRLRRILIEIHEHGGAITLWYDKAWLQRVQAAKPSWAKAIFEEFAKKPHVHDALIRQPTR